MFVKALSVTASRATSPVSERLCESHLLLTLYPSKQKFIFENAIFFIKKVHEKFVHFLQFNYSSSSVSGVSFFFLLEARVMPIAVTEAMSAVMETIMVREPSPMREPA